MIQNLVKKVFGSRSDREMKQLMPMVDQINQLAENLFSKSDDELKDRTQVLKTTVIAAREAAEQKAANDLSDKDEAKKIHFKSGT